MSKRILVGSQEEIKLRNEVLAHLAYIKPRSARMDQIVDEFHFYPPTPVRRCIKQLIRSGHVGFMGNLYYATHAGCNHSNPKD